MSSKQFQQCIWSGRKSDSVKPVTLQSLNRFGSPEVRTFYVLPEHEEKLREFNRNFVQNGKSLLLIIIITTLIMILSSIISIFVIGSEQILMVIVGTCILAMSFAFIKYPFATPETVKFIGIYKAIRIVKIAGFTLLLMGVYIIYYGLHLPL